LNKNNGFFILISAVTAVKTVINKIFNFRECINEITEENHGRKNSGR
jgi:hypothetical protein